ncbi:Rad4 transglutaminase-like domain-containing protein [Apiospora phragmitis]|uniref:Rad4 transglutaminase-like domain-containing protein n=1 Tax=Apiospora phragmitis TaxID=2905665 RepID=A0ABR1X5V7_9PEZI
MPPHVPRKRLRSRSPVKGARVEKASARGKGNAKAQVTPKKRAIPRKSTLFDDLDAGVKQRSAEKVKSALQQMHEDEDDASDSSSLSSHSDAEFEDVPAAKRQKVGNETVDASEDDDDMEFEDVPDHEHQSDPVLSGDLELTLYQDKIPLSTNLGKKGPTKQEKQARILTHCMHVQFLMWHNAIRNSWLCDQEVQAIMISHLPPRLWEDVERWRRSSGLDAAQEEEVPKDKKNVKGKPQLRSKGKGKQAAQKPTRVWGKAAERLEKGVPDMSHGDPLFRLMKLLNAWWKQRFRVMQPGLRKIGYMDMRRLAKIRGGHENEEHDPEKYGERIKTLEEFRICAQECNGSRDVGAQLFTALLRGLGLEARLVANLQCLGFGWSKAEEAGEDKPAKEASTSGKGESSTNDKAASATKKKKPLARPTRRRTRKSDADALTMDLDESDEFADPISEENDDDSVVEVTFERTKPKGPAKSFDKDLEFPHYWTEVLSPVTNEYLPVDAIVKSVIGTSRELIESLEPRGSKADKAKQIMAYVVGFSQDGTAKDVTVRYLKKRLYPGRTKGFRMPVEKVPIYNTHGKVKRYEQFDWFKKIMSGYARGSRKQPVTEIDELEESTDLKPAVPEKKEVKEGEETLQYYKQSKEYVLARHLKREEALLPSAVPVKVFRNKGKGNKVEEEDVYLRKDVVEVKSAETWHKSGRAPLPDAEPLKHAPYRAATTNRRREIAEMEARTGEKVLQPLYSIDQTDWIIPEPIKDGVIPKNDYGNIDMFAEHMCPEGAVHVPYRGTVKVCKRLGIDFAEAVVGFEFGHRMAVPVIHGVVVAEEHEERVLEELEKDEAERKRKEDEKRRKAALSGWRKFIMGLRVADRLKQEYANVEDIEVFHPNGKGSGKGGDPGDDGDDADLRAMKEKDENMGGGFLPEGHEEDDDDDEPKQTHSSSYFPMGHEDDDDDDDGVDPFEIE